MPGARFTVEIDEEEARERLTEMVERMARPFGFYKNVGEYLTEVAIPRNFKTETAPDGTPWATLSPATLARYEAKGTRSVRILHASGHLQANIAARPSETEVLVGTAVIYAGTMQFGAAQGAFGRTSRNGPIPWGDIPARPFLGISAEDEEEIIAIAADWLEIE